MVLWFLACVRPPETDPTGPTDPLPTSILTSLTTSSSSTTEKLVRVGALTFEDHLPRNLLVVSLDTTRRDYVGRYSGGSDTPNLDAFLDQSLVLENHRSCSNWTGWSMTCFLSGRNQMQDGFATWSYHEDDAVPDFPPDDYETVPGHLTNQLGWDTVLVTSNSVLSSHTQITRGFVREVRVDNKPADVVRAAGIAEATTLLGEPGPWYLHVHFLDPHGNYCPPAGYFDVSGIPDIGVTPAQLCEDSYVPGFTDEPSDWQLAFLDEIEELYRGEIRFWDENFGTFLADLDAMGALDDTLVVFVTDHGQQFFERIPEHFGGHGHGNYLGSEENRAVAAFWAKNLQPGSWQGPTTHEDLAQTLYELYGLTPNTPTRGSLVGTAAPDRVLQGEQSWGTDPLMSIVVGDHQLIYGWTGGKHFYKLEEDPTGVSDVYDPTDPDVLALWPKMSAWVDEIQADWPHLGEPALEGP